MKSILYLVAFLFLSITTVKAQMYDVLDYNIQGTPVNGVKIKTNLPFTTSSHMPTIIIEGFNYFTGSNMMLSLNYYYFNNAFIKTNISTSGNYNPDVYVAGENGKIVLFIDDRQYFQRFHVRVFAKGLSGEAAANFTGWTVVDSTLIPTAQAATLIPYKNSYPGDVQFAGNGIWKSDGNVGIGTTTLGTYKLAVNGTIGAKKVKVTQAGWADYVFNDEYILPSLDSVEQFIKKNRHLPEIPSEAEVISDGQDVGEMNKLLLKKVEELTLYLIEMRKELEVIKGKRQSE
ncbi:hypothetical protein [Chitinophaga rhizophila]|uniref:Uncharacterized protein n=1 Tax=Chitinophaga rhizophila TaxID=2866212 RepID=A0ABS7G7P0_9BACT|nr:hypothetical protein [Chitinophaga rhizophila]MBW8683466.1 hypothetical protein [Chitinophaga rhizophila]